MQPQIYEKTKLNTGFSFEGQLWGMGSTLPRVSNECLNETNTIKHCLKNNKLSVIDNANSWEAVCATEGFYRSCRGKEQLNMVEDMWIEEFNNRLYNKESLQRYNAEATNNRMKNLWF